MLIGVHIIHRDKFDAWGKLYVNKLIKDLQESEFSNHLDATSLFLELFDL